MKALSLAATVLMVLILSGTTPQAHAFLHHPQGGEVVTSSAAVNLKTPRDAAPAALLTKELLKHARNKNATAFADLIDDNAEIFISSMNCAPISKAEFVSVATNYTGYRGFWTKVDFSAYRTVFMTLFGGMIAEEDQQEVEEARIAGEEKYQAVPINGIKIIAEANADGTKITKFREHIPESEGRNPPPTHNQTLVDVWSRMSSACENHNATALGENLAEDFVGNTAIFQGQTKAAPTFTKAGLLAGLAPTFKAQRLDKITVDMINGNSLFTDKCGYVATTYTELMAYDVNSMPGAPWPQAGMFHSFSLIKVDSDTLLAKEWTVVSEAFYFE